MTPVTPSSVCDMPIDWSAERGTDQAVTKPFCEWLDKIRHNNGVGANEAWNAGVAYARAALAERTQQEARPNDVDDMCFVERWAVHHASKPTVTAEEALSVIAHYPPIRAITESYKDGKRPETFDPYAEIERLKALLPTSAASSTAPMQPSELLPCPFCGGAADIAEDTDRLSYCCWTAFCETCDGSTGYKKDAATAAGAWNDRAKLRAAAVEAK
jgi:Lar family restriction alleviation protein